MAAPPSEVFISYSHDSIEQVDRVLALAERLRSDGIDAQLDQYVAGTPPEGWPRWTLDRLDEADFVLVVCTETYYRRFRGYEKPGEGKGAEWEGNLITRVIHYAQIGTTNFAPICFRREDKQFIPEPLQKYISYLLDSETNYGNLYAFLTRQQGIGSAGLGSLKKLAHMQVAPLRFGVSGPVPRTIHNLPFPPNPTFTGRDVEMKELEEQLHKRDEMATTQTVAIHGLGGVGKTQIAVEYAWTHLGEYSVVLWLKADSPEALEAGLAALTRVLGLPEVDAHEQATQTKAVLAWLRGNGHWLLIADSADTEAAAKAARERLPPNLSGHVLITSRLSRWPVHIQNLPLGSLSPDDASRYLLDRVSKEGLRHYVGGERGARLLALELGNLPLALEQAAGFIIELGWTFDKFREQLGKTRSELLNEQSEGGTRYPASIAKTWNITLDRLSPLARSLLRIAAWFAPDNIPGEIFSADKGVFLEALEESVDFSDLSIVKALRELDRFSLIRITNETVSMHRLLQAVEQDSLTGEESKRWLEWATRLFNAFSPESPGDVSTWGVWVPLWPHAETLLEHTRRHGINALSVAVAASTFGLFLQARAAYAQSEALNRRALAIFEEQLGPNHPEVATRLNNLAQLLQDTNRLGEAEPLMRRALAIDEQSLGPHHPNVATDLNILARLMQDTNQPGEAEPLMRRALAIDEQGLGPDHPNVATDLNNLARLLQDTNHLGEAEPLMRRALAIDERSLGSDHPAVATRLNNLAQLLQDIDELGEAEPLMWRALAVDEQSFGPHHPRIAIRLSNLALLLKETNRLAEAEPLMRRALSIDEHSFGPDHPNVATDLNNLALLLKQTNRFDEAEPLYRRAVTIILQFSGSSGHKHPHLHVAIANFTALLEKMGQSPAQIRAQLEHAHPASFELRRAQ
jgi:tetratricopeptide (TPR) repeat protein